MRDWGAAESIAATIIVLCGVGGAVASIAIAIEMLLPMSGRARRQSETQNTRRVPAPIKRDRTMIHTVASNPPPTTRLGDAETSREAAAILRDALAAILRDALGDLRFQVWLILSRAGEKGLADFELRKACEAEMGARPESTYRKRRSELSAMGLAVETGHRRENGNGRAEMVHRARTLDEVAEMVAHLKSLDRAGRKAWIAANKSAKALQEAAE